MHKLKKKPLISQQMVFDRFICGSEDHQHNSLSNTSKSVFNILSQEEMVDAFKGGVRNVKHKQSRVH